MDQRFCLPPSGLNQRFNILNLLLSSNALLHITEIAAFHPVFIGGSMNDGILLCCGHPSGGKAQSDAGHFTKPTK